jgi:hypothetical protein
MLGLSGRVVVSFIGESAFIRSLELNVWADRFYLALTFGREVIGYDEHAFLHFARLFGAKNNEFLVFEAKIDAGLRTIH